ncbi:M50 family metallopeptidase [Amnibacterium kyonggiense]|uniref:Peptidase M50B-like protein n=1 Tax=Amnibacterium kyonggiense TaxID=595671 RepID=A0A4R7FGF7_9MICO|nr:M50 family metallopeptidase [Amnibacterium kyonggiense]TDS75697.1 peptidase M50B-like protein [Amnibacterium kyonggiense]
MTGLRELAGQLWARVIAVSPAPGALDVVAVVAIVGALLLLPSWPRLRHAITIVHEAGHGFAATLTRRRLAGIRLHSDSSGLTVSVGRPRGPGMALTLLAGYPAPSAAGVLVAWAVAAGHAAVALWGALVLLLLVLVQIRNWFGLWTVLVAGALVGAVTWFADPAWQMRAALAVAALLVLGGLRAAVELPASRRRDGASDADQLARVTRVPVGFWLLVFVLAGLVGVAVAGWLVVAPLR